ncbi:GTPase HflX [Abditibacteriota bacterium]|nr:GTPase HflX [Abditibacteriota bacterium]
MSNHPEKEITIRNERGLISTAPPPERALLAQLILPTPSPKNALADVYGDESEDSDSLDSLEELEGLAEAAGVQVVDKLTQKRSSPDSAILFGKGKVEELKERVAQDAIEVVIVDCDLTPAQGRNLEKEFKCRVIDRTELILDIFARRAQTKQAKMQVELAQLRYQLPRLKRMWSHLERQGGTIGLRGPGETQLEIDKSLARGRISQLEKQLSTIRQQKNIEQAGRREFDLGALVGYTNVGKSALLNALSRPTGRGVLEADMLFATLGATTRRVELGGGRETLLSDTVGLVRRLPHHLVESFHSTLAEVEFADYLLFVASGADDELEDKLRAVRSVLDELNVRDKPSLLVLNQADKLTPERRDDLERRYPDAVFTSALTGQGLDVLRERIFRLLDDSAETIALELPAERQQTGRIMAQIARHGRILKQDFATTDEGKTVICVEARLAKRWWELAEVEAFLQKPASVS